MEEYVETEESAGGDDGEHHGVLLCHRLRPLAGLLLGKSSVQERLDINLTHVVLLLLLLAVHGAEAAQEDRYQCHDDQAAVRHLITQHKYW